MFNLLQVLPEEDKVKIKNYILTYGVSEEENFVGLDEWLKHWSIEKIKMYKLLNNSFLYKEPFSYAKPKDIMMAELRNLIGNHEFLNALYRWRTHYSDCPSELGYDLYPLRELFIKLENSWIYENDEFPIDVRFRKTPESKEFRVQKGMKPIRVCSKLVTYFKDEPGFSEVAKHFEDFRIRHSQIFNEKEIKGNIVLSIHPLDFMTMSDNDSGWSSCMSWKAEGCYHVGTVEMMNSNNVLCCYIEREKEPFYFNRENKDEEHKWNNKKYRQLCYVTKDIVMSGKAYPYKVDDISKIILSIVRKLAEKNFGWKYTYGPELYKDMKYVNSNLTMNRARWYRNNPKFSKKKIMFDTRGMYNDMLNDHGTNYWCIRNEVKKNKIINVSGKTSCLCCGKPSIYGEYDGYDEETCNSEDDYNSRFKNVGNIICEDCYNNFVCDVCGCHDASSTHQIINAGQNKTIRVCNKCLKLNFKICPVCNKPMQIDFNISRNRAYALIDDKEVDKDELADYYYYWGEGNKGDKECKTIRRIFAHKDCLKQISLKPEKCTYAQRYWTIRYTLFKVKDNSLKDFYYENLKDVTLPINDIVLPAYNGRWGEE